MHSPSTNCSKSSLPPGAAPGDQRRVGLRGFKKDGQTSLCVLLELSRVRIGGAQKGTRCQEEQKDRDAERLHGHLAQGVCRSEPTLFLLLRQVTGETGGKIRRFFGGVQEGRSRAVSTTPKR